MMAVDLCSGAGGMTAGMMAAGFQVVGYDVVARRDYPAEVRVADVRDLDPADVPSADWIHASPPCERFSQMRPTRVEDPPTEADLDILQACLAIIEAKRPRFWSVENVRGSVRWFEPILGPPRLRHGPYYFWGNFPAFLVGRSGMRKAMQQGGSAGVRGHRSPWLRAKLPLDLTAPMASAIAVEVRPLSIQQEGPRHG